MREKTAAIIVIGNEILSGKVVDSNAAFLTQELRGLGVSLRRILVIPDEVDAIAEAVHAYQPVYDVLFTSGGVGPTHDDVTMEGIARGLGRRLVRHPAIESRLREFYKEHVNDARLKMSEVPEGAELLVDGRLGFPTVKCENFYILPGIPELFEQKFEALRERFSATPYTMRVVYTREGEGSIAEYLNATLAAFPELLLGSYPKLSHPEYTVKLDRKSTRLNSSHVENSYAVFCLKKKK